MGVSTYQYHLKDHLGNVRMTLTSAQESYTYLATMETELATEEEGLFGNIAETRQLDLNYDHTHLVNGFGDNSARLNANESNRVVGPTLSLYVNAGDTVKMKAYAKYLGTPGNTSSTFVIADEVTSGFGLVSGGETAEAYSAINSLLGSGSGFLGFSSDPDLPKAYLTYHYFDTDHNYITSGFMQVSTGANGVFEELALAFTADQQGYVYIYVANETQADFNVFFDDVEVEHGYGPIVQAQSFYPFGATFGEYKRALSKPNRFLFNQGTGDKTFLTERQFELQVDMSRDRTYDFWAPHWWQIDAKADQGGQESWSPYHYSFNNPIRYNDPYGLMGQTGDQDPKKEEETIGSNIKQNVKNNSERLAKAYKEGGVKGAVQLIISDYSVILGLQDPQENGYVVVKDETGADPATEESENIEAEVNIEGMDQLGKDTNPSGTIESIASGIKSVVEYFFGEGSGSENSNEDVSVDVQDPDERIRVPRRWVRSRLTSDGTFTQDSLIYYYDVNRETGDSTFVRSDVE